MKTLAKKAKKGFTIVELVIVIAVIAILAAVLIPTFSNVIASANESAAMQECRNEWTNFLPEIAADSTYNASEKTYYVAYVNEDSNTTIEYLFIVEDGSFNADAVYVKGDSSSSYSLSTSTELHVVDDSTTYKYTEVKIFTGTTSNPNPFANYDYANETHDIKIFIEDGTVT